MTNLRLDNVRCHESRHPIEYSNDRSYCLICDNLKEIEQGYNKERWAGYSRDDLIRKLLKTQIQVSLFSRYIETQEIDE